MRRIVATILLLMCVGTLAAAPVAKDLQGKWHAEGQLKEPTGPGMSWYLDYTFKPDGTYSMDGYPPIEEHGQVLVAAHDAHHFTLTFTHRVFMNNSDQDLHYDAILSADAKTLIFHDHTFHKTP